MKFSKLKRFLSVISTILVVIVIVFLWNITKTNHESMSEIEVRSQLEQMYDVKVASVKMDRDVYEALITKSGTVYEVEMDAISGEVSSLKQSDNYIIKEESDLAEGPMEFISEPSSKTEEQQPLLEHNLEKTKKNSETTIVKRPSKIIIRENKPDSSSKVEIAETPKTTENTVQKSLKSATSKVEEKVVEEKPSKEVSKETLKLEVSKQEETKKDTTKEENIKTEETIESNKSDPTKNDTSKTEVSKAEEPKTDEVQTQTPPNTAQSETKKPETETKPEKPTTVLITEEQAIKKALQQQKGIVESSSFVKTNEGGYYLIVMKSTMAESDSKESTKKTKATIQVHAISGKILSVTWE